MSKSHLLIEKAFIYDRNKEELDPEDSEYNNRLGAWVSNLEGGFLVKSNNPSHEFPRTKKNDHETGEDQKGA